MPHPHPVFAPAARTEVLQPKRRYLTALTAMMVVGGALLAGAAPRVKAREALHAQSAALEVPVVQVTTPKKAPPQQELELPADIQAEQQTPIFARTSGYLKSWNSDIGTHVSAGQALATIESPEVDDQLRQAQADERQAQANYDLAHVTAQRWRLLQDTNSVSLQEVDTKVAEERASQAILAAKQSNVSRLLHLQAYEQVSAPFDGIVTARNVDIGALVDAGSAGGIRTELFEVAKTDTLRVYVDVPQDYSSAIVTLTPAYLTLPQFPGRRFAGRVARTTGAIDPTTRTLRVEIDIPNPRAMILPGSYGQVHLLLTNPHPGYSLPVNALLYQAQGVQVATVDAQSRVALKTIMLGRDFGTQVEVASGLVGNEFIILNPSDSIARGAPVRVAQSNAPTLAAH